MTVKPGVAWLMLAEAVSLAVMSTLHLTGRLNDGHAAVYQPSAAGIAEAIIGAVLFAAGVVALVAPNQARPVAVAATSFAIVGFAIGITMTIRGGSAADIAYHATVLPILLGTLGLVLRSGANSPRLAARE
ncbi:MAG TPA: hypothetical protein VHV49_04490 [Pseudonocardiaceae bacterium]|nr:hypothetical protein [Pseudonocardiaceae bacterium]